MRVARRCIRLRAPPDHVTVAVVGADSARTRMGLSVSRYGGALAYTRTPSACGFDVWAVPRACLSIDLSSCCLVYQQQNVNTQPKRVGKCTHHVLCEATCQSGLVFAAELEVSSPRLPVLMYPPMPCGAARLDRR